jgi:hypothetical protein
MSALLHIADSSRTSRMSEKCQTRTSKIQAIKNKSRPKAALISNLRIADYAAVNAGFDFRQ